MKGAHLQMEKQKIYNPLDKWNIANSIGDALLRQTLSPLNELKAFDGAGVYAIYYRGDFAQYQPVTLANQYDFTQPIYVGKAVPEGARRGGMNNDSLGGPFLFRRLQDHAKSINAASTTLDINSFHVRFLVVDDIWIPLGESLLIEKCKPIWNCIIDGFGNHDPGNGRYNQQRSMWDSLHPGRNWAEKLRPGKAIEEIHQLIAGFWLI